MSKPKTFLVDADPAKGFFVSMLVKDITLKDAIGDLVDNSVDAIKEKSDNSGLSQYHIKIDMDSKTFSITDNGYGMESEVARKTAFNFGKSDQHQLVDYSIGQFGIGMKRAFFKIGKNISVFSKAPSSQFKIDIDVLEWLTKPKEWKFHFNKDSLKENIKNSKSDTCFKVNIKDLNADAQVSFGDPKFIDSLIKEIALEHMLNINKGLRISVNNIDLPTNLISLVNNDSIKPAYFEEEKNGLKVKILAGISDYNADDGGWYVFCNERLILAKDTSAATVWTGTRGDGVPLWHSQYYRFRGFVFFEANDSSKLPWNTTKTGMDVDSPAYKNVRGKMISMTREVLGLLDKLKDEKTKDNPEENRTLNKMVDSSLKQKSEVSKILNEVTASHSSFQYPVELYNPPRKTNVVKISYQVSKNEFEPVSDHLGSKTPKDVGLKTFKYFYENEL